MAFILTLLMGLLPLALQAQELPEYFVPPRSAAMGGASVGVSHDESSIWTNPAGIGRIRKVRARSSVHMVKVPNLVGGSNNEGRQFYSSFQSQAALNQDSKPWENIQRVIEATESASQQAIWLRASANPIVFFEAGKNTPVAIGPYTNNKVKSWIDPADSGQIRVDTILDTGAVLGLGLHNRTNRWNLGLQLRPIQRYALEDKIPVSLLDTAQRSELQSRIESSANIGTALAIDAGMMFTVADYWFPTLGIAVFNLPTGCYENYLNPYDATRHSICGTVFNGSVRNKEALSVVDPTDIRIGVSIMPRIFRKITLRFAADLHHLYVTDGTNFYGLPGLEPLRQLHGGVEVFVGNPLMISPFSARIGFAQGFLSGGFGLRMGSFALDATFYGADISENESPREDRRTVVGASLEF
ncbi:MAG: hypothetical protein AB8C84_00805 [Oligoflexales bacterium]